MKSYLVTGGAGFIGSNLVKKLVKCNHQVRVLDNVSRGSFKRLNSIMKDIEIIDGDIRNPEDVQKACINIDTVCHLAYVNGTEFFYSNPTLVLDVAVKGMINILDACIKNNVQEFILASSSEVYQTPEKIPTNEEVSLIVPDPFNPRYSYGGGKIISELMAIHYGKKYFNRSVIFRPHNVYGPDMGNEHVIPQFARRLKELHKSSEPNEETEFPIQGTGQETRAFIYIDDFTEGVYKVIEKGENKIYHIGTMQEVKICDVAIEIGKYYNRKLKVVPGNIQPGSTTRRCPDVTELQKLGFQPKISLADGIRNTVKWYDQNG